jgi:predicted cupin superfamily sugar epimerase
MNAAARQLIAKLQLEPLPREGGFFRQTWRNERSSAILFVLTPDNFSALHRLAQDELWHFHGGDRVEHVQLDPQAGTVRIARLGPDVLAGDEPQVIVPRGTWQGGRTVGDAGATTHGWSLLGCTVSPPWDERGFALGEREALLAQFPSHSAWVRALTR